MENGIGIAEDAKLVERKALESEVLAPSKEASVKLNLDESENSKADEVFEDAVEAPSPTEIGAMISGRNVELDDNNKVNSDAISNEVHRPEEVIVAPSAVQFHEDSKDKIELLLSEEKQIGSTKTVVDETNGMMEDSMAKNTESIAEDGKSDHKKIVDSAFDGGGETENQNVRNEITQKLVEPKDGISNKMSYAEAVASGEASVVDADTTQEPETLSIAEAENEGLSYETSAIQNVNQVKGSDIGTDIPENGSFVHDLTCTLNHEGVKSVESDTLTEQIHEKTLETEEANSNGNFMHNNGDGHNMEKLENTSSDLHSQLKENQVGDHEVKSSISCANLKDDKNEKQEEKVDNQDVDKEEDQKQVGKVNNQDVAKEENSDFAAADTSATGHAGEISGRDADLRPKLDDGKLNLETAEVEANITSSELLAESSKSAQQTVLDASAVLSTTAEQEEEVKDEKKDQDVQPVNSKVPPPNAKPETKPAADISSATSLTPPQPAGLGQSSRLPEPPSKNKEHVPSAIPARPAGLGRAAPLLEPTPRPVQQSRVNGAAPTSASQNQLIEDPTNTESGEEYDETREKLQMIRVKFLRLAHRLGQTPHNVVVAQVLYRLGLAEQLHGRSGGRVAAFSFDRASAMAENLESAGQEPLDFTCTIMVLGKSGVGKSATINSIFDQNMFGTDAFQTGTKKVQDIVGTVQGIRVRVVDTPGLLPSWSDQRHNEKILRSVKKFIKKTPPDIVLYLDRLDMQSRDFGDMPLLRTITDIFGPSIWFNAIVVLTHAASAPPDGPNGTATSYDMFVTQRSHVVQQAIRQAAGDMRLMNPVSLVENHSACRTNPAGQRVLPNGQVWKPHLLLLSFASKILAEANTLLKLQDTPPGRPFAPRTRSPPLPFLLSSLLQSRPEVKLPSEQFDDDDDVIDDDLDECSEEEEESEYDELPPFKSLTKAELEKLTRAQRKAYYDELEYREKLFMKKQLKEERKRRKFMKKMQEAVKDLPQTADTATTTNNNNENVEGEMNEAASVPVAMPDLTLPVSFDSDNPTHRYRSLDSSNPWLIRAVLEPNGWDHDIGYDGINVERLFVVREKVPISFSGHISKDKKDSNLQMEIASSIKHGKGKKATSLGFDMQSVGKDYAYTLRGETRFINHKINKATAGMSATVLGDVVTGGVKLEDKLVIGKRGQVVVSGGAIYGRGEAAYGGSLEATLKDKDHPLGRFLSTLGVSVMDWHGDLAIGCNSQTQIPIGRHTNLIGRFNINNRGAGQVSVRVNSSEQLQIILIGLIPLVKKVLGYSQQMQYG